MSNLILIASEFPYYSGESFLENELPFLSKSFNEIYIFSIYGKVSDKAKRSLPNNAKCFPLENVTSKLKYLKYLLAGALKSNENLRIRERNIKRFISCLYSRGRAIAIAEQILNTIRDHELDTSNSIVYSYWFSYQAIAAFLISKSLNAMGQATFAVSRAHGYDLYWERAAGRFQPFQDASLKNLKWCFPCSEYGTKYLCNKYPWAEKKIKTKKLGTTDFGLNPFNGEKTLVTCCNLEALKRISLFAEAFCEIAKEDKRIKWICIGSGEEEKAIQSIVSSRNLEDQVVLTGRLSNKEVMNIYKKEGIMYFFNVSKSEGLPVSIMEAMSFGIPIIATNVGGTSELVDSSNGRLIPADLSKNKLTIYIRDSLHVQEKKYRSMRISSRMKWEQYASANKNYKEFCDFLISEWSLYLDDIETSTNGNSIE